MFRFFRKNKTEKKNYHFLYNTFVNTGLYQLDDSPPPSVVEGNPLAPRFFNDLEKLTNSEFEKFCYSYLCINIHNAIFAKDFPKDEVLVELMDSAEQRIRSLVDSNNQWANTIYNHGLKYENPDVESIMATSGASEQMLYQISWGAWSSTVEELSARFAEWHVDNKDEVIKWYNLRLSGDIARIDGHISRLPNNS